jgi:hypothetical protein
VDIPARLLFHSGLPHHVGLDIAGQKAKPGKVMHRGSSEVSSLQAVVW